MRGSGGGAPGYMLAAKPLRGVGQRPNRRGAPDQLFEGELFEWAVIRGTGSYFEPDILQKVFYTNQWRSQRGSRGAAAVGTLPQTPGRLRR